MTPSIAELLKSYVGGCDLCRLREVLVAEANLASTEPRRSGQLIDLACRIDGRRIDGTPR